MSAGAELMELQMAHEDVMNTATTGDTTQILMACKSFWLTYNSLELGSGVLWITQTIVGYADEVRAVEARYNPAEETTTRKPSWRQRCGPRKGGLQ
jgi:hypothetical protein